MGNENLKNNGTILKNSIPDTSQLNETIANFQINLRDYTNAVNESFKPLAESMKRTQTQWATVNATINEAFKPLAESMKRTQTQWAAVNATINEAFKPLVETMKQANKSISKFSEVMTASNNNIYSTSLKHQLTQMQKNLEQLNYNFGQSMLNVSSLNSNAEIEIDRLYEKAIAAWEDAAVEYSAHENDVPLIKSNVMFSKTIDVLKKIAYIVCVLASLSDIVAFYFDYISTNETAPEAPKKVLLQQATNIINIFNECNTCVTNTFSELDIISSGEE